MDKKQISLEVINPNAAGIGSRSHWVAVRQNAEDVKVFGMYSRDQLEMCDWLRAKGGHKVKLISFTASCPAT